jgi:predicted AAA+ superfamily ATPase
MASRGKGARAKGASFEREVAKLITEKTGLAAKRGLGQARAGGSEVADVEVDHIHIEAKRHIKCNIKAAMKQAIADSQNKNKPPVVITKDDYEPILVTMLFDDWVQLFNSYLVTHKIPSEE